MRSSREDRVEFVERLLSAIVGWAECAPVCGLALVGSYARGAARYDSDVDLVMLVENPLSLMHGGWLEEIDWRRLDTVPRLSRAIQYGVTWSIHVLLDNGVAVEFGCAPLSWASAPLDPGTRQVISNGWRVLYDPDGLLRALRGEEGIT